MERAPGALSLFPWADRKLRSWGAASLLESRVWSVTERGW